MLNSKFVLAFDRFVIGNAERYAVPAARAAFFVVFFWFGLLKVLRVSPAIPLVDDLLAVTMPFMDPATFDVLFGLFEMLIGTLFLFPRLDRVVMPLFVFHMATTMLPLVLLPAAVWSSPFVPTLVGQYILKNFVLVALAVAVVSRMKKLS